MSIQSIHHETTFCTDPGNGNHSNENLISLILTGECHDLRRIDQESRLFSHWYNQGFDLDKASRSLKHWQTRVYKGHSASLLANPAAAFRASAKRLAQRYHWLKAERITRRPSRVWLHTSECERIITAAAEVKTLRKLKFAEVTFKFIQYSKHLADHTKRPPRTPAVPLPQTFLKRWISPRQHARLKAAWKRLKIARLVQGANPAAQRCEYWRLTIPLAKLDPDPSHYFTTLEEYLTFLLAEDKATRNHLLRLLGDSKNIRTLSRYVQKVSKSNNQNHFKVPAFLAQGGGKPTSIRTWRGHMKQDKPPQPLSPQTPPRHSPISPAWWGQTDIQYSVYYTAHTLTPAGCVGNPPLSYQPTPMFGSQGEPILLGGTGL